MLDSQLGMKNESTHSGSSNNPKLNLQLDAEFDQHLANMKKFILDLSDRKAKHLCALWVKKLCEMTDSQNVQMKNIRNNYSMRLLNLLENRLSLERPFDERPPVGQLRPLEENFNFQESSTILKSEYDFLSNKDSKQSSSQFESDFHQVYQTSHFKAFDENKLNNFYMQSSEFQIRSIEARFKEEKLSMQQTHTLEMQKILERKNSEIELLKSNNFKKKRDYDENLTNLEKKVLQLTKEVYSNQEEYDKNILLLKNQIIEVTERKQIETDKKLKEIVNNYEKEKFDLQVQHTKAFQDLVDETNVRLKKVESEYNEQQNINDNIIAELENRTHQFKNELDNNAQLITNLERDNKEKTLTIQNLEKHIKDASIKLNNLESENQKLTDDHTKELDQINCKIESIVSMKDTENQKLTQKISLLNQDVNKLKNAYERKFEKLNNQLREKESIISNANNTIIQQKLQADAALNDLKKEIELNSTRLYNEMKEQMLKVETDLEKSRSIKEKQLKESQRQLEELRTDNTKAIERLNQDHERQILSLRHEFESEKQKISKHHESTIEEIQNRFQQQAFETNQKYSLKIEHLMMKISQHEAKCMQLERDLVESDSLRKQQITELGILREDEQMKINRNNEIELETFKLNFETERNQLKKMIKQMEDDFHADLKYKTKRFEDQIQKLTDENLNLQEKIHTLELDNKRNYENVVKERNNLSLKFENEKNSNQKHYQNNLRKLEKELELEKGRNRAIEERLKSANNENDNYILSLKMQYEEKIKGLLPSAIRKDLEDTIVALKKQIESLQQRTSLLQSELDEKHQLLTASYQA